MTENEIGTAIIECAIEVHRELGPGLPETVYEVALSYLWLSAELCGGSIERWNRKSGQWTRGKSLRPSVSARDLSTHVPVPRNIYFENASAEENDGAKNWITIGVCSFPVLSTLMVAVFSIVRKRR